MGKITIAIGTLLIFLGVGGFVLTGGQHKTALIPAVFGIILEALGVLTIVKPSLTKHLMHAAVLVALLGFIGTVSGVISLIKWIAGTVPDRPGAVYAQSAMAVILVVYIVLAIQSFVAARRRRDATGG